VGRCDTSLELEASTDTLQQSWILAITDDIVTSLQGTHIFSCLIGVANAGVCEAVSGEEIMYDNTLLKTIHCEFKWVEYCNYRIAGNWICADNMYFIPGTTERSDMLLVAEWRLLGCYAMWLL
jgi:hypothetical protein